MRLLSWKKWSLRKQLLVIFGGYSFIFLVVIVGIILGVTISVNTSVQELAETKVTEVIKESFSGSALASAAAAESFFIRVRNSVNTIKEALTYMVNDDEFTLSDRDSFFDNLTSSHPGRAYDTRCQCVNTLNSSVYYIPGSTNDNFESMITSQMAENIRRTAHIDSYYYPLYRVNSEFLVLLLGMEVGDVYRRYPGVPIDPSNRLYNPTSRPWYTGGETNQGQLVFAEPYKDAFGKGWVMTATRSIDKDGLFFGVFGIDFHVTTVQDIVGNSSVVLGGWGYLAMNVAEGYLVAHEEFGPSSSSAKTVFDVEEISVSTWNVIRTASSSGMIEVSISDGKYFLYYVPVLDDFVYVAMVSKDKAEAESSEVVDDLKKSQETVTLTVTLTCVVVLCVVLLCVFALSLYVSRTVSSVDEVARQITEQASEKDRMFDNLPPRSKMGTGILSPRETRQLAHAFYRLIDRLRDYEHEKSKTDPHPLNPYYNNPAMQVWKDGWTPDMIERERSTSRDVPYSSEVAPSTTILPPSAPSAPGDSRPPPYSI